MKLSLFAAVAAAGLVVAATMAWIDPVLSQLVHQHFSPALVELFGDFSRAANGELFVALACALYLASLGMVRFSTEPRLTNGFARLGRGALLVMATLLSGGVLTVGLKLLVSRARPTVLIDSGFYGMGPAFMGEPFRSFPSGHAMAVFALAAALAQLTPKLRGFLIAVACLVALCRVFTLAHFLSDIMVSAAIAFGTAHFWSLHLSRRGAFGLPAAPSRGPVA